MMYKDVHSMIQGLIDTLEAGDAVVRADDRTQLLIGFRVDRPDRDFHAVTLMAVKMRKGVSDDIAGLITSGWGREQMAWAMTHRHQFTDHGCELCEKLLVLREVMES
jgi:hypothetical protein